MTKTFDTSRVGGGTYELEQDSNGNYKLKSVGFDQVNKLTLPDLTNLDAPATTTTPKDEEKKTDVADPFKKLADQQQGGGEGVGQDYSSIAPKEAKVKEASVSELGQKTNTTYNAMTDAEKNAIATGTATVSRQVETGAPGDNQFETVTEPMTFKGVTGKTYSTPRTIADQNKFLGRTFTDKTTGLQKVKSTVSNTVKNIIDNSATVAIAKGVGKVIGGIANAITDPYQQDINKANTDALKANGYVTNFEGKVIGKDGKAVSAADSVFGGMNSRSAFGDISKGAQKRIDTIEKTISKMTPAQKAKSSLPARKEKFEKELREHNNERVASREDKSGATGKNKGGFTNPGAGSYGPHSGGGGGNNGGGRGKIVCTMMNESYGFGSFRNKIWLRHSKNLAPEYQRGYHKLFLPLVKKAKTNKILKKILEHIAIHRTIDIRQEERNKIHLIGRIYRTILEPICYWAGKK